MCILIYLKLGGGREYREHRGGRQYRPHGNILYLQKLLIYFFKYIQ